MVYLNYFLSLTDIEDEVIMVAQRKDEGKGVRELGIDMYTLLYLKWTTHKVL